MRFSFLFVLLSFSWHGVSQRIELKSFDPIIGFNDNNGELSIIDDTNQVVTYNSFGKCIQKERIVKKAINFNELKIKITDNESGVNKIGWKTFAFPAVFTTIF